MDKIYLFNCVVKKTLLQTKIDVRHSVSALTLLPVSRIFLGYANGHVICLSGMFVMKPVNFFFSYHVRGFKIKASGVNVTKGLRPHSD